MTPCPQSFPTTILQVSCKPASQERPEPSLAAQINVCCFTENAEQNHLLLKTFLSQMATIIGRDPSIFFDALMATCYVNRVAGRPFIQLKPTQKASSAHQYPPSSAQGMLEMEY